MEWERKFYDIVRETETNLSNARMKLQGNAGAKTTNAHFDYTSPSRLSSTAVTPSASMSYINNNDHINSIRRQMGWSTPITPRTSYSASGLVPVTSQGGGGGGVGGSEMRQLLTKIDSQNVVIDKLERLVRTLNQEKEQYRKQIRDLQNEVGNISSRLNESRLTDPHLETQVDLMRHEVRSDLQRLQNMITSSKPSQVYNNSLERSFKDMQQSIHTELDQLRRTLNTMTQRVGRLELDVSTNSLGYRDAQDRFKMDPLSVSGANQPGYSSVLATQTSPNSAASNLMMSELRSTVTQLHDKLDRLESRIATSRVSPPVKTSPLLKDFGNCKRSALKSSPKLDLGDFLNDDDDDDVDDLSELDLEVSDDLDFDIMESDDDDVLSTDLDDIIKAGKSSRLTSKLTPGSKVTEKVTEFSMPTSSLPNTDSEAADLLSEIEIHNLEINSTGSDPIDLDSLDEPSDDLKVDDL